CRQCRHGAGSPSRVEGYGTEGVAKKVMKKMSLCPSLRWIGNILNVLVYIGDGMGGQVHSIFLPPPTDNVVCGKARIGLGGRPTSGESSCIEGFLSSEAFFSTGCAVCVALSDLNSLPPIRVGEQLPDAATTTYGEQAEFPLAYLLPQEL